MTVREVNIARVYNETFRRNQIAKLKKADEKTTTGTTVT